MSFNELQDNLKRIKELIREAYVFTNQLEIIQNLERDKNVAINQQEKRLLTSTIISLEVQLKILNNSIPKLVESIGFFEKFPESEEEKVVAKPKKDLVKVQYKPEKTKSSISLTIGEGDRKKFLENLSRSNLSISQLKKKYGVEKPATGFGKPNAYAKLSNRFFRKTSNKLLASGRLEKLNAELRKMNSPFVVGTYVSMILFTMTIVAFLSSWALWAFSRLPMEVGLLGWKFTLIRLLSTVFVPPLAGLVAQGLFNALR